MTPIDEYLKSVDEAQKAELERVRGAIKKIVPELTESISYGIPALKYKQKYLVGFAAFKDHMSLFPTSGPIAELKAELTDFKTSKGTIQFTLEQPIPDELLKKVILARFVAISS